MGKGRDRRKSKAMAYEAVKQLSEQFPEAFSARGPRKPLKVGICVDLFALGVDRRTANAALRSYVRSYQYLIAMTEGAVRVDPFGQPAGVVTAQDAADAKLRVTEKYLSKAAMPGGAAWVDPFGQPTGSGPEPEQKPAAKASAPAPLAAS